MPLRKQRVVKRLFFVFLVALILTTLIVPASADHRDGPVFENTAANGRLDIGDLFVFRSPANANNSVFIMTVSPFAGNLTPASFQEDAYYDFKIDTSDVVNDPTDDITFRVSFSAPDGGGVQDVVLRALPGHRFPNRGILAKGKTGQNIPVAGGGQFRAAIQDDPFFFDQGGWDSHVATGAGAFPRPFGTAHNFYGPNCNILAITLEIPSSRLGPNGRSIGVWARTELNGVQQDREGRPFINTGLIPPVPRNNLARGDRRNAFNAGHPKNDRLNFKADMVSVLQGFYGRSAQDADNIANRLLPDVLIYQIGNPTGFATLVTDTDGTLALGGSRRLTDDVTDTMFALVMLGSTTTDNVSDDNDFRITDGSLVQVIATQRAIAFPYIGAPNLPLNGPGTGPNP